MIKLPPKEVVGFPLNLVTQDSPEKLSDYLELHSPVDRKGRYLHFNELRHRFPSHLDAKIAWSVVKFARKRQSRPLISLGEPEQVCSFFLTPQIQKALSETDRNATSASLEWMTSNVGEAQHFVYLLNDLVEDESISSSQLEGAATTTKVAKDLLKRKRKPRSPDERMIIGNFKMMQFAWENRHKKLSLDLILNLHQVGVEDIDDDKYSPGALRQTDDVEVVDGEGNTVYTPPPAKGLAKRLKKVIQWANECHHDIDSREYIHPLVKAVVLHFVIGFEHPFRDGNGRVARSLFYWYMFKNDYAAFRYIAISVLLKKAPVQYGKSYLHTETDAMDLTYFIDYQCGIIIRAIAEFKNAYQKTLKDIDDFNKWLWDSGLYKKLSDKQKAVFQVAKSGLAETFTAVNVKENIGCSYNTASTVLNGLVELGLFKKKKIGREWVFFMLPKQHIIEAWKG